MLVPRPGGKSAAAFAAAVTPVIADLPDSLRRSLTWDQGEDGAAQADRGRRGLQDLLLRPALTLQRPSNENTNGLLRQYFPKGSDLSKRPSQRPAGIADELNGGRRKVLGWKTPAEAMAEFLDSQAA